MHIHSPSWFVLSQQATANLQQSALIPSLVFTTLALIVVVLRWYSRIRLAPDTWHIEDFIISAALASGPQRNEVIELTTKQLLSIGMTAVVGAGKFYLHRLYQVIV